MLFHDAVSKNGLESESGLKISYSSHDSHHDLGSSLTIGAHNLTVNCEGSQIGEQALRGDSD